MNGSFLLQQMQQTTWLVALAAANVIAVAAWIATSRIRIVLAAAGPTTARSSNRRADPAVSETIGKGEARLARDLERWREARAARAKREEPLPRARRGAGA